MLGDNLSAIGTHSSTLDKSYLKSTRHSETKCFLSKKKTHTHIQQKQHPAIDLSTERRQDMATGLHLLLIGRLNFQDKNNIILGTKEMRSCK